MATGSYIYRFDDVAVDTQELRLSKSGEVKTLEPKAFAVLEFLIDNRGRLVTKDEILDAVWKDSFVTPNVLTRVIAQIRRALDDDPKGARYIETVPTRGYRFIAEITEGNEPQMSEEAVVESSAGDPDATRLSGPTAIDTALPLNRPPNRRLEIGLTAIIVALLVGAVYLFGIRRSAVIQTDASPTDKTLAVLPFKLLNRDEQNDYLSVGLTDSLITKLSNIRSLTVRPTSSVIRYSDGTDAADAGRQLQVESVIDGSVQRSGDQVRVTVRLVRSADGKSLWGNTYDSQFTNIFQVQDEISALIADALRVQLSSDERARLLHRPTDNIEAYQSYLRGKSELYKFTPDALQRAVQYFNQAISIDPNYALAYAGLAAAYSVSSSFGDSEGARLAQQSAEKSLELDPLQAETHAILAASYYWRGHNIERAKASFDRAIELDPNSSIAHHFYSWFLVATGQFDAAEKELHRALKLDPLSSLINVDQGLPLYFSRQFAESRTRFEKAIQSDPNFWITHLYLGQACEALNDLACSQTEFQRAVDLSGNDPSAKAHLARTFALAGKTAEARKILDELGNSKDPRDSPYYVSLVYLALGEKDIAYRYLDRARSDGDKWLGWAKVDPRLDPIRSEVRFTELMQHAGL